MDYLPIDAHYHDLEHTLQGITCMARLLRRRQALGLQPQLTQRMFELGMLAMLMHDTGYLKKRGDASGTGAKYTLIHVDRSIEFAGEFLAGANFASAEIQAVQNMIRCTGVNVKLDSIQFQSEMERVAGFALGTADLLGQMAAPDYVDKLPILYSEFAEAARYSIDGKMKAGGFFSSAEDLMLKTPLFWENYVRTKIAREFLGIYRALNNPYPDGPNLLKHCPHRSQHSASAAGNGDPRPVHPVLSADEASVPACSLAAASRIPHVARLCFAAI